MAIESLKFLTVGDHLTAAQWNEVVRQLNRLNGNDADGTDDSVGVARRKRAIPAPYHQVILHNNGCEGESNDDSFGAGGVAAALYPLQSPVDDDGEDPESVEGMLQQPLQMMGMVPNVPNSPQVYPSAFGKAAVTLDTADYQEQSPAVMSGVVAVQINVDEGHEWYGYADLVDGEGYLQTYPSGGAQIIWQPLEPDGMPESGCQWAVVRLGNAHAVTMPFEVRTHLEPGGNCEATPMFWTGTTYNSGRAREAAWVETLYDDVSKSSDVLPGNIVWARWEKGDGGCGSGRWEVISNPAKIRRVRLLSDLYECGTASAVVMHVPWVGSDDLHPAAPHADPEVVQIFDPINTVLASLLALESPSGLFYIPSGTCAYVTISENPQPMGSMGSDVDTSTSSSDTEAPTMPGVPYGEAWWEPIAFGMCCLGEASDEGSEGSEEGSEGSEEGSEQICLTDHELFGIDLPEILDPVWALGKDANGCIGWVAVADCGGEESSGSGI